MRKPNSLAAAAAWVALFLSISLISCKKLPKDEAYFAEVSKYVYAYSSGAIGRSEPVRVRFTRSVVGREQVGQPVASGIFKLSPSVEGQAVWEDDFTLVFRPKNNWEQSKKFNAEVNLQKLFAGEKLKVKIFDFDFSIRQLAFEVVVQGLAQESSDDAKKQQVLGMLRTSNAVENADVEKLLAAEQEGKSLTINWSHAADGMTHSFFVKNVERGNARSKVKISWSGKPFDLSTEGSEEVVVPGIGEFAVVGVRVEQSGENCVVVNFSDPISPSQDLTGLIRIQGYAGVPRFAVDGNFVRVYPVGQALEGNHVVWVEPGIKNTAGGALATKFEQTLSFENLKPAVRLVGRGSIIPKNSEGRVLFPFEAVGLNAVDVEVFKIFNSNILQFLQVNDLDGNQELERVGKIILQKKVALSDLDATAKSNTWARYALDLQDIVKNDPNAIYQIRLAFRHGYTTAACPSDGTFPDDDNLARFGETDENGVFKSIFGGYYGIYFSENDRRSWYDGDGDEDDFQWSNRENPCKREFYSDDHFVKRNAFISDLGLMAKKGRDGSWFVAATNLLTAEPESAVSLEFFNFQHQPIIKSTTDGNGTMRFEKLPEQAFVVVASKGDRRGYLKLQDGNSLSLSRFDVAGVEAQRGLKGYLYGERGVWRPGDSLFLNFVLEDATGNLPTNHPVSLELTDPKGSLQAKIVNASPVGGVYAFHLATRADAPTGNWTAKVLAGGAKFTEVLKIETVKPNRLKINLDFGKTVLTAADEDLTARLSSAWLHGAAAQNLKARVELQVRSVKTEFKGFDDFTFDDPARKFTSEPQVIFENNLDANGTAQVSAKIASDNPAPGKLIANFRTRVFERSGDFSTDNFSMDYYPYPSFVGISVATDKYGNREIDKEKGGEIRFVCVDQNGKPLANRKLEVGLYRCDWRWWWDSDEYDNVGQFNSATHVNARERGSLMTNAKGEATWKVRPGDWGRYLVRATDATDGTEGSHCAGDFFWSGYPDNVDDMAARNGASMLPFSSDKKSYKVGDEVVLKIPASEKGRILVTLETGNGVLDHFWREAVAGDNLLKFKVDETMSPTVYAHVSLMQPHAQTKNSLPIRMYGVSPIAVENPATRLEPVLAMPEVLKPGENFTVNISEKTGKACAYTLAIVDDGLLDLTRFKTPNPHDAFFAREALGVKTWDVYDYVLGAFGAEMGRLLAIGGDGINTKAKAGAQVTRFKPVVRHLGPFQLKKGERKSHTLKIENYVGSVRAMLVCSAPGVKGKNAYGSAEKTCPVRQPLMVLPTLPRVLGPGETLRLPVNVFAMEDKVKNASVSVSEKSGLVQVLTSSQNLSFPKIGDKMAYFDLKVGNRTGAAKFKIAASGAGESAGEEIEILVRNPNPPVTLISENTVPAGGRADFQFEPNRFSDIRAAVLEVSSIPPLNLSRQLDYLIEYPHGCVEQTTSGAFPQLYVDLIAPLDTKQQADIQRNVAAAISKLQNFQTSSGGFGYWPGDYEPQDWCSSYVGHFLLEAKNKGFTVPQQVLDRWVGYQTGTSKVWAQREDANAQWRYHDSETSQAYRLYTLAMAGKPDLASMNRLRETKNRYSNTNYLLAASYAAAGKPEVARELLNAQGIREWQYDWYGYTYGSSNRDLALKLETQTLLGDAGATATATRLATEIGKTDGWHSTQELATSLRAISKFAQKNLGGSKGEISVAVGSGASKSYPLDKPIFMLPLTGMAGFDRKISVQNRAGGQLFARVVFSGQPTQPAQQAFAKNISLDVKYLDSKGNALDVNKLQQGTDFTAEVTVARTGDFWFDFNELALTQIFPSGWEILNSRTSGVGAAAGDPLDYQDIRDDRVLTYFDLPRWSGSQNLVSKRTYRVQLNAAYGGRYFMPGVACEAMYDSRISSFSLGRWVEVI